MKWKGKVIRGSCLQGLSTLERLSRCKTQARGNQLWHYIERNTLLQLRAEEIYGLTTASQEKCKTVPEKGVCNWSPTNKRQTMNDDIKYVKEQEYLSYLVSSPRWGCFAARLKSKTTQFILDIFSIHNLTIVFCVGSAACVLLCLQN